MASCSTSRKSPGPRRARTPSASEWREFQRPAAPFTTSKRNLEYRLPRVGRSALGPPRRSQTGTRARCTPRTGLDRDGRVERAPVATLPSQLHVEERPVEVRLRERPLVGEAIDREVPSSTFLGHGLGDVPLCHGTRDVRALCFDEVELASGLGFLSGVAVEIVSRARRARRRVAGVMALKLDYPLQSLT